MLCIVRFTTLVVSLLAVTVAARPAHGVMYMEHVAPDWDVYRIG
jgi:hypothetical protein